MALKIAFYQSVWPQTLLSRKKKKDWIQRMKTRVKPTGCPLTHALAKAVNLSPSGSVFFLQRWEGCHLLQLSQTLSFTISCPKIHWAFFLPQNPECFIENMHTFFPYTTIQNGTITFVNNTMDAKPHITHFPPSPKTFRDATLSPSPVFPAPTCPHYRLWE